MIACMSMDEVESVFVIYQECQRGCLDEVVKQWQRNLCVKSVVSDLPDLIIFAML